jgi:hypothetical protein
VSDAVAPGSVRELVVSPANRQARLSWVNPSDPDLVAIEIVRREPGGGALVFRGVGSSFADLSLRNGRRYTYAVTAIDIAGNRSEPVTRSAVPTLRRLIHPVDRARVTAPPLLVWRPVATADFYNVQLFRAGTKLLSRWPARPRLQLPRSWVFSGRTRTLRPGLYTWYVWPAYGPRTQARYGTRLGASTFYLAP